MYHNTLDNNIVLQNSNPSRGLFIMYATDSGALTNLELIGFSTMIQTLNTLNFDVQKTHNNVSFVFYKHFASSAEEEKMY